MNQVSDNFDATGSDTQMTHETFVCAGMARLVYEARDTVRRLSLLHGMGRTLSAEQVKRLKATRNEIDRLLSGDEDRSAA